MATLTKCNSYSDADSILGNRSKKKIGHNTYLMQCADGNGGQCIQAFYHETPVVTYFPNGIIEATSGGWKTVTTKDRLNQLLPTQVWQAKGIWTVKNGARFFDGIRFDSEGNVLNPLPTADTEALDKENRKIKRQIKAYTDGFCKELVENGLPMPSNGDCWYCLGLLDSNEHLLDHMEEKYYVPSLAINALRESGYQDTGIYFFLGMKPESDIMGKDYRVDVNLVKRSIGKYMRKRLVKNP